jgi:N-methylhydantoinase A
MTVRIGADVGGTFTDVVLIDDAGKVWTHKVLSSPPDGRLKPSLQGGYERAVLEGIEQLLREQNISGDAVSEVAHGTTVATNAVLEHRGARTALVTTKGIFWSCGGFARRRCTICFGTSPRPSSSDTFASNWTNA